MTVGELIEELKKYDPELPVGGGDDMGMTEIYSVTAMEKLGSKEIKYIQLDIERGNFYED